MTTFNDWLDTLSDSDKEDFLRQWFESHSSPSVEALRATPTPLADASASAEREAVRDAIAEALGDAYDCTRVWSAWGYGTMSSDDFVLVAEDESRLDEITDAALSARAALATTEAPMTDAIAVPYAYEIGERGRTQELVYPAYLERYASDEERALPRLALYATPSPEAPAVDAQPVQKRDDTGRLTSDYEPTPHEIKVARDAICREFGNNGTDGYYIRILKAVHGAVPKPAVDALTDCDARIRKWRDAFDAMHRRARKAEAAIAPKPAVDAIYQLRLSTGDWRDQDESAYRYNAKYCPNDVRIVYAHPASEPKALILTDEQRDTLKLAIGYIGSSTRDDRAEHIARIQVLLADRGSECGK